MTALSSKLPSTPIRSENPCTAIPGSNPASAAAAQLLLHFHQQFARTHLFLSVGYLIPKSPKFV
jgi:hypothetical protein